MVSRERTIYFPLRGLNGVKHQEVLGSLRGFCSEEDLQAVQLTNSKCFITFKHMCVKTEVQKHKLIIGEKEVDILDSDQDITNVTVKDLPVEVSDDFLVSSLLSFGEVVSGSVSRGKIKGTQIETGTRYVRMLKVKEPIPNETRLGDFPVRIFCDNGKTLCKYCKSPAHPFYKCPQKRPERIKQCFICKSTGHLIKECPNRDTDQSDSVGTGLGLTHSTPIQNLSPPKTKLVLGASNIKGLTCNDPAINVLAESGMTASEVDSLLDRAKDLENYSRVAVHLGTNDLKQRNNDNDSVVLNIQHAVTRIRDRCPHVVQIGLCSIPPKKGSAQGTEKFNEAAKNVNSFLRKLCDQTSDMNYIDISQTLTTTNGKIRKALYSVGDQTGFHYSQSGREEVLSCIERALSLPADPAVIESRKRPRSLSAQSPDDRPEHKRYDRGSILSAGSLNDVLEEGELAQGASIV